MSQNQKRRVIKNLKAKSINVQYGLKSLDPITYTESPLEADYIYHLEYDANVFKYMAQPPSIPYFFKGVAHSYTPDFEVHYIDGSICYVEVKYIADTERIEDFEEWVSAIRKSPALKGHEFKVIKEDFIREGFYYENLQTMYSASNINVDSDFLLHILEVFSEVNEISIFDLMKNKESDLEFEQIYRLIFDKVLLTDLKRQFLSKQSIIQNSGEGYDKYL